MALDLQATEFKLGLRMGVYLAATLEVASWHPIGSYVIVPP